MDGLYRVPLGQWGELAFAWFEDTFGWLIDFVTMLVGAIINGLVDGLLAVPPLLMVMVLVLIGWLVRSWQLAAATALMFVLDLSMGYWESSMQTLGLVLFATIVAVPIAVPLGILAAKNDRFSGVVKLVLDFMQTMPAFVYLIPAVLLFGIGYVPGVFATIVFALPPGVRFTELGIRGVDSETVEAGHAFGATNGSILRGIELPLATPTIMAGINQVIMLSLSMAVLAGFVGADGLGKDVVTALSTQDLGLGIEAGLCIVFIAVYLDRVTAALGKRNDYPASALTQLLKKRSRQKPLASVGA